jgi:serine/threonine-protein kinase RsbW
LEGRLAELERLAGAVGEFCRDQGIEENVEFDLNLVLEELFMNSVHHGGCAGKADAIQVKLRKADGAVQLEYADRGTPYNPLEAPEPDLNASLMDRQVGGLGVHLMRRIMTDLRYERSGDTNHLSMTRRLDAQ